MPEAAGLSTNSSVTNVEVLIVGAGFSGLCMAIKLLEAGVTSFLIIEKSGNIGGTWWENRYPGCACDIPSHLSSFSFAPSTQWTRMYPGQQEIHDYLSGCVERFGLAPYLRLNTRFREAIWDESEGVWNTTAGDGLRIRARVLVSGMGALHTPTIRNCRAPNAFPDRRFILLLGITTLIWPGKMSRLSAPAPAPSSSSRKSLPASATSFSCSVHLLGLCRAWTLPSPGNGSSASAACR
jgi:hypothetical protein